MASPARVGEMMTLEEFLRMPEIDERPYLEYVDGRVETKMSPQMKHGMITMRLLNDMLRYAEPEELGLPVPELRCTFAGRSIIPDVVFLLARHIVVDADGTVVNAIDRPPDLHVEIVSPNQSVEKCREKLRFSVSNGCPLGWLIDPEPETVHVYRPGRRARRMPDDGVLEGEPVLPGYRLIVADIFRWMKPWPDRNPGPPNAGSGRGSNGGPGR
jgi:Uma2 family endonuclease